jgi:PKD repeat protein
LPTTHSFRASNLLHPDETVTLATDTLKIENPPESVRVIKIIDSNIPATAPEVTLEVPADVKAGEAFTVFALADDKATPAVDYTWDFGDGTPASGQRATHTYTSAGSYFVTVRVRGVDGLAYERKSKVTVTGNLKPYPNLEDNRRYRDQND